jgi:hypothetical protein
MKAFSSFIREEKTITGEMVNGQTCVRLNARDLLNPTCQPAIHAEAIIHRDSAAHH